MVLWFYRPFHVGIFGWGKERPGKPSPRPEIDLPLPEQD